MRVGNQAALQELAERIAQADAVVIGGGSGLSSAAGYDHYHWSPALSEALAPFREQYGFTSPLAGFYHCFSSYGEQWGYYSQYMRFMWEAPTGQPYLDQQFFRVFPQKQICAFQGDFSYCQCSQPCRDDIWENREIVKELTGYLVGVRLPEEAVPRCPDCGRMLVPWVRDDTFLEGTFWQDSLHKLPFWELTAKNENVFYACLNREVSHRPEHLRGRSLYLQGDLAETLAALRQIHRSNHKIERGERL